MLIDWFTVIAQLLNFLLLVWLLKRFLYQPILNAIDAREKDIAAKLTDADGKRAAARKEHEEFDSKNKAFDDRRNAIMAKATADAKSEHDRLLEDARKEAEGLRASEADALKNDLVHLSAVIKRMAQAQVFSIARKTLADLATASLEERIGEVFTRRLRQMDGKGKEELGAALKSSRDGSLVRSAFDLPAQQKESIQNALNETFSSTIRLRYEVDADAIGGIELTANGQKLCWSIASYLDTFDDSLAKLLDAQAGVAPGAPSAPAPSAKSAVAPVAQ